MSGTVEFRRQTTISKVEAGDPFNDLITDGHTKAWYIWNEDYTLDGSGVTALNDQSGNGYHLAPTSSTGGAPTSANYPTWHSTNGITFDGVDDVLKATMSGWTTFGSIYAVIKQITWTDNDVLFSYAGTGSVRVAQDTTGEGSSPNIHLIQSTGGSLAITNFTLDTWGILTVHVDGAANEGSLALNNGTPVTNNTSYSGYLSAGVIIGATHAAAPNLQRWGNIAIKEIIFRDLVDDSTDADIVYNYLYDKYFS